MFWIIFLNRHYDLFRMVICLLYGKFLNSVISNYRIGKGDITMQDMKNGDNFLGQVVQLFRDAKRKMSMAVNMAMVYSYYDAGRLIIDEEQNGSERAAYGKYILQELSRRLTAEFGRGFSYENLKLISMK